MRYRIFVVDDEKEIVNILKTFLTKSGFEVITAYGGEKAMGMLSSGFEFDLVILDMKMPKIKGTDILQEMKRMNKREPVIILSGSIDLKKHEAELKAFDNVSREYLIKPIDLNQILDKINEMLGSNPGSDKC